MSEFVMRNYGSVLDADIIGMYLKSYDPEAHGGMGNATWTKDVAEAMKFPTALEVMHCWRQQSKTRPMRPDGHPNRPLTAYTIEPVGLDGNGQPMTKSLF